jgi:hypothetical protein
MTLQPLDMQMSVIEGYYDDGQEFTKTVPIYKETYTKDKHLFWIQVLVMVVIILQNFKIKNDCPWTMKKKYLALLC